MKMNIALLLFAQLATARSTFAQNAKQLADVLQKEMANMNEMRNCMAVAYGQTATVSQTKQCVAYLTQKANTNQRKSTQTKLTKSTFNKRSRHRCRRFNRFSC